MRYHYFSFSFSLNLFQQETGQSMLGSVPPCDFYYASWPLHTGQCEEEIWTIYDILSCDIQVRLLWLIESSWLCVNLSFFKCILWQLYTCVWSIQSSLFPLLSLIFLPPQFLPVFNPVRPHPTFVHFYSDFFPWDLLNITRGTYMYIGAIEYNLKIGYICLCCGTLYLMM